MFEESQMPRINNRPAKILRHSEVEPPRSQSQSRCRSQAHLSFGLWRACGDVHVVLVYAYFYLMDA